MRNAEPPPQAGGVRALLTTFFESWRYRDAKSALPGAF
jgi:hypothetical protein